MATTGSFIMSLATSFLIFCLLLIVYAILLRRPGNAVVYYPGRILRGENGPELAKKRRMFSWVKDAYRASEDEIVAVVGLGAAVYMHLFIAALEIIALSALLCMLVLITLAATSHNNPNEKRMNSNYTYSNFDNLGMGNIEPKSAKMWAFLFAMFWVSFVTYYVPWKSYRRIVFIRDRAQASAFSPP